jgi:hypothetical protein
MLRVESDEIRGVDDSGSELRVLDSAHLLGPLAWAFWFVKRQMAVSCLEYGGIRL